MMDDWIRTTTSTEAHRTGTAFVLVILGVLFETGEIIFLFVPIH